MSDTTYTFWKLLEQYHIEIPMIQRDYAQGRDNAQVLAIRSNFIQTIHTSLINQKALDFDFIYGKILEEEQGAKLLPLDGQQRLTTLYLLHWYLGLKESKEEAVKLTLGKFTYETRVSSRDFCRKLASSTIKLGLISGALSKKIKDKHWYASSWDKDPTIASMLVMLDAIHENFKDSPPLFDLLINENECPLTFQFLALENFGLTDNLYIRMNARGKALTKFENFKAKFEQFLEKNHPTKAKLFTQSIDGKWTDFFWQYKQDNLIDTPFMNFFEFLTEMLFYRYFGIERNITKPINISFKEIEEVYSDKKNIDFLFSVLDLLSKLDQTNSLAQHLFSERYNIGGNVCLFESEIDVFQRCFKKEKFAIPEKILLFTIIRFLIINEQVRVEVNLKDLIRVVRNLLYRVRQSKATKYVSNLRYENISEMITSIDRNVISAHNVYDILVNGMEMKGFSKDSINHEIEKAKAIEEEIGKKEIIFELEDHELIRGTLFNFHLNIPLSQLKNQLQTFKEIWSNTASNSLIIRSMLSVSPFGSYMGRGELGDKYYLGQGKGWHRILTSPDDKIFKGTFQKYLDKVGNYENDVTNKLHELVKGYLENSPPKDWVYYFIKYPEITNTKNPIYMWRTQRSESNFEIRRLSKTLTSAQHINPFVKTIMAKLDKSIYDGESCYTKGNEESPLFLSSGIRLYCKEGGWIVVCPKTEDSVDLSSEIISAFRLEVIEETIDYKFYLLRPMGAKDRVEVAIDFIQNMIAVPSL